MFAASASENHGVSYTGKSMYRSPRALDNLGCSTIRTLEELRRSSGYGSLSAPFAHYVGTMAAGVSMAEPSRTYWTRIFRLLIPSSSPGSGFIKQTIGTRYSGYITNATTRTEIASILRITSSNNIWGSRVQQTVTLAGQAIKHKRRGPVLHEVG